MGRHDGRCRVLHRWSGELDSLLRIVRPLAALEQGKVILKSAGGEARGR